jgi:hypothetical protein
MKWVLNNLRILATLIVLILTTGSPVQAQDRFPDPVPPSGISVKIDEIAVIPDSSSNLPPRISVLTQDPSGRLFANDQRGPLYLIDEATGNVTEYLDIRDYAELAIVSTSEAGFQSFAFHPDFLKTGTDGFGRFYTIHSCNNTTTTPDFDPGGSTQFHTLVLEWRTSTPTTSAFVPASMVTPYREVLRFKQPFGNHNGGLIAFNSSVPSSDPDYGNLYIALADGGSGGDPQENGQDPSNPYGAILRINPLGNNSANGNYGIVAENSFASDGNPSTLAEIYCYGFRNPQRFGWDAVTGNCFVADIGQNAVEEINLAANGANFGWDEREGSFPFEGNGTAGLTDPVAEYDHTNPVTSMPTGISNRAVTVGEVIRGACIPSLEGMLPIADFPTGLIFLLNVEADPLDGGQDGITELTLLNSNGDPAPFIDLINASRSARGLSNTSRTDLRFSVNTPGRIYLTNKHDGIIRRIRPTTTPDISIGAPEAGLLELNYSGRLQTSQDLATWEDVLPQPAIPSQFSPEGSATFLRAFNQ